MGSTKVASNPAKVRDVSPEPVTSNLRLEGGVGVSQVKGKMG